MTDRDAPPLRPGDFVWTNFPFQSDPDRPGPIRHIACVIATFSRRGASRATNAPTGENGLVVGVYTSSQVRKFGDALPVGVVQVGASRASRAGEQKPFFIDTRVRAFLPFDSRFFPLMELRNHGLVGRADQTLFREIVKAYGDINQRRAELIVNVGPFRPR